MSERRSIGARLAAVGALCATLAGCGGGGVANAYRDFTERQLASGNFRQEVAPLDAPYTSEDLFSNFLRVAFLPEAQLRRFYDQRGGRRTLSRWEGPISYRLTGSGVTAEDAARVARLASVLSIHSGLAIGPASPNAAPNLSIIIENAEARRRLSEERGGEEWYAGSLLRDWVENANPPCFLLFVTDTRSGGAIQSATIFVLGELEDPLRTACLTEEFTQALGLPFDHDDVRPSIFNDDQEFIALTNHDRELIEILYDRRLRPGMTERQAAPVVRRIVDERRRRAEAQG